MKTNYLYNIRTTFNGAKAITETVSAESVLVAKAMADAMLTDKRNAYRTGDLPAWAIGYSISVDAADAADAENDEIESLYTDYDLLAKEVDAAKSRLWDKPRDYIAFVINEHKGGRGKKTTRAIVTTAILNANSLHAAYDAAHADETLSAVADADPYNIIRVLPHVTPAADSYGEDLVEFGKYMAVKNWRWQAAGETTVDENGNIKTTRRAGYAATNRSTVSIEDERQEAILYTHASLLNGDDLYTAQLKAQDALRKMYSELGQRDTYEYNPDFVVDVLRDHTPRPSHTMIDNLMKWAYQHANLTPTQNEIYAMYGAGYTAGRIQAELGISRPVYYRNLYGAEYKVLAKMAEKDAARDFYVFESAGIGREEVLGKVFDIRRKYLAKRDGSKSRTGASRKTK